MYRRRRGVVLAAVPDDKDGMVLAFFGESGLDRYHPGALKRASPRPPRPSQVARRNVRAEVVLHALLESSYHLDTGLVPDGPAGPTVEARRARVSACMVLARKVADRIGDDHLVTILVGRLIVGERMAGRMPLLLTGAALDEAVGELVADARAVLTALEPSGTTPS